MSVTEIAPLIPEQDTLAVDSDRFFDPANSNLAAIEQPRSATTDPLLHALGIYCLVQDVMPTDRGRLLSIGMTEPDSEKRISARTPLEAVRTFVLSHVPESLDDPDLERAQANVIGLTLDGSAASQGWFGWEATIASSTEGVQTLQLHVIRNGLLAARQIKDRQGSVTEKTAVDPWPVFDIIKALAVTDSIKQAAGALRKRQHQADYEHTELLRRHVRAEHKLKEQQKKTGGLEGVIEQAQKRFAKEAEDFEKQIGSIGFPDAPLQPLIPKYQRLWLDLLSQPKVFARGNKDFAKLELCCQAD